MFAKNTHIHIHLPQPGKKSKTNKYLKIIMTHLDELNLKIQQLTELTNNLQSTVDAEQVQIQNLLTVNAETIAYLNEQKAALEAQIANGASPEQLATIAGSVDELINKLTAVNDDVASTVASTVAEEPVAEEPTTPEEPVNPESSDTPTEPSV